MIRFFNPSRAYMAVRGPMKVIIDNVLLRGDLILRQDVIDFEESFAKYVGMKYAVGVASGTDALMLSMKALGVGKGDEVITTSYTFRATVEAIVHAGATPVLADLDEDWTDYITSNTKAVIPAHLEGLVLDWEPVDGIHMIEDSCQAIGAAPVKGIAACYSFYPAKILGCYGDGGAIATNDKVLCNRLKKMRNHFKDEWKPVGYNSRLDNLQAAVLNFKLKLLPSVIARRKEIAHRYDDAFKKLPIGLPMKRKVYQDYIVTCATTKERDSLHRHLTENKIESLKNEYPFPEQFHKKPLAVEYEKRGVRIPCNETLEESEIDDICVTVKQFFYAHGS